MELPTSSLETSRPFLTWQRIVDWAKEHYRERTFSKDEQIPARPGLIYLLEKGAVRLVGQAQVSPTSQYLSEGELELDPASAAGEEAFLGFVTAGEPFEIVIHHPFNICAYAHVDETQVIWLYWNDLDNWAHLRNEIQEAFRRQHQRKLLWLSTLGQKHTLDRLFGFLNLLVEEYGEPAETGYYLPYALTHAQIGSAIGSTRVTVTRLMGKLRQLGLVTIKDDHLICLNHLQPSD